MTFSNSGSCSDPEKGRQAQIPSAGTPPRDLPTVPSRRRGFVLLWNPTVVMMGTYGMKSRIIVLFWRTLTAQSICIYITDTPK